MTKNEYNIKIWSFYLQLENDFYDTLNYVEFSTDNFSSYSKEYSKQLLSICSEIDILCKRLCEKIMPDASRNCISDYAKVLCSYDNLTNSKVRFYYDNEEYAPFGGWTENESPLWWKDYNAVKHNRTESNNYKKGNLENVFNSLAALYVLNRYYCKIVCNDKNYMKEPEIKSKLFDMVGWTSCLPVGNGFVQVLHSDGRISMVYDG